MRRRLLLAAALLLAVSVPVGILASRKPATADVGVDHDDTQGDEFLGGRLLDLTDWWPDRSAPAGKETHTPVVIDGRPGERCQGRYASGGPCHEEILVDGKQHGRETWWDEQGRRVEEKNWRHGYLHGRHARWYADDQIAEEEHYDRSRLHGSRTSWHRNGRPATRAEYRAGRREGEFTAWHPSGSIRCKATFKADQLEGPWREWDAAGKLVRLVEYREGAIVAETPARRTRPFTYPGELGAPDFALIVGQGSERDGGYYTLHVSAAGRCECRYFLLSVRLSKGADRLPGLADGEPYTARDWRRVEFQLSELEQRQLRDALEAAGVFGLQDEYVNKRIADGTQWVVCLRAGGREKRVYCSNFFPTRLRELSRSIHDYAMAPHRMELLTATQADEGPLDPADLGWPVDPHP
jgi:hypothetical protein